MSVNTLNATAPSRAATHGIVGPQSGADPEARLRRLLMMGAQERKRAMQRPSTTGAALCLGAQQHPSVATGMLVEVAETHLNPPHVLNGVSISTTPGMWSGHTLDEVMDIGLITPVDKLNSTDEDGYRGVAFSSRHCDYRFFVYRCYPLLTRRQIAYMVLARPPDDSRVYTFK
jgi:hypothetical protein